MTARTILDEPRFRLCVVPGMDESTPTPVAWPLSCRGCAQRGTVTLEGRKAIGTSDGFYLKIKHPGEGVYLITCAGCGTTHPYPP
jgi:hypothetical protein